jgi:hypothetical protein
MNVKAITETICCENQESNDQTSETPKIEEETSLHQPPPCPSRVLTSVKIWSENKQKFFYKPNDAEYAKRHYYKHRRNQECGICKSIVVTQMYRHVKTRKCLMVKEAVQAALEKTKSEETNALENANIQ